MTEDQIRDVIAQWRERISHWYGADAAAKIAVRNVLDDLERLLTECVQPEWQPTADAINALPEPLRRYIYLLQTRCDPAGDTRELWLTRDENAMLRAKFEALAERPQPQEARTLLCETCGHSHYFEVDEAGFDSAEVIPWGKCKTCDCEEPSYTDEPLGPPPQDAQE